MKSNPKIRYPAKQFYEDLQKELQKIAPNEFLSERYGITLDILSFLLGQGRCHVSNKKQDNTQIALDLLEEYNLYLNARLSLWKKCISKSKNLKAFEKIEANINSILIEYQKQNQLNRYARGISSVFDNHPYFKIDYFAEIDSKSKAYWLGWLFAEGWISQYGESANGKKPLYRFGVACSNKDAILIKRFAEEVRFDVAKIKKRDYKTKTGIKQMLVIRVSNFDFCEFLRWHGFIVGETKSTNIRLPRLKSRESYLAFLLGYFDGDGKQNTTMIASGSKTFLVDIKEYFDIPHNIRLQESKFYYPLRNSIIQGKTYLLSLGADIFNEMLANFSLSLKRKRKPKLNLEQQINHINRMRALKRRILD